MFVRKAESGSAPGFTWHHPGDVHEVPDDLAWELLGIPGGGFSEAGPPRPEAVEEASESDAEEASEAVSTAEAEMASETELTRGRKAAATRAANKAAAEAAAASETADEAQGVAEAQAHAETPGEGTVEAGEVAE
jgi:hypothetical protein